MTGTSRNLRFLALSLMAITVLSFACSSSDPEPTPEPTSSSGLPAFLPYIFGGNFTIAGEPGPQGTRMFARLGDSRGPFNDAIRQGEYINVSITPENASEVGQEITFFIGDPEGPTVQAGETYVYLATAQPQIIELDLTFPRLP